MPKRLGVLVAIIAFAMSANSASAITVPITAPPITPTTGFLQEAMVGLANGAEQVVTSIEAVVGRIAGETFDRLSGVDASGKTLSYTAGAATAVAPNPDAANMADEPVASGPQRGQLNPSPPIK